MSVAAEGLRGSCLCGAVAFVLTTPLLFVMHNRPLLQRVAAGVRDDTVNHHPEYHLLVPSKAPYFTIHDKRPQHAAYRAQAPSSGV